jgi:hypothetical protein
MTTLQASLHVADWPVATSPRDARRPASTSTFLPMPGATLPRTLASPRTGLAPAGYPELGTRLHPISLHSLGDTFADARAAGRTLSGEDLVGELATACQPLHAREGWLQSIASALCVVTALESAAVDELFPIYRAARTPSRGELTQPARCVSAARIDLERGWRRHPRG